MEHSTILSCPVCESGQFSNHLNCKDYTVSGENFQIQRCESCGFLFTSPRPAVERLGEYYKAEAYISHTNSNAGIVNKLYKLVRNYTLGRKYSLIKPWLKPARLLDIGSGTGAFLAHCNKQGVEAFGVEPDANASAMAEKLHGVKVYGEEQLQKWEDGYFPVITMWHVLEHVPDLNERVETLARLLSKNGRVFIAVPNYRSFDAEYYGQYWAAYDVPRHLYHFDKDSIGRLFAKHGFTLEKMLPMKFDSYYVSMLSEKYKNGRLNILSAFFTGLRSNLKGGRNGYSSQIYVFRK